MVDLIWAIRPEARERPEPGVPNIRVFVTRSYDKGYRGTIKLRSEPGGNRCVVVDHQSYFSSAVPWTNTPLLIDSSNKFHDQELRSCDQAIDVDRDIVCGIDVP